MRNIVICSLIFLSGLVSCNSPNKEKGEQKESITVSILPQKYFVEKIVGDHFNINVMIPPGASPVTYEPTPKQMKELSKSKIYIRIGHIEFEKAWMNKFRSINPRMEIIDQSDVAELIASDQEDNHGHGHKFGEHHHRGIDPHIWTSPKEVKKQIDFLYLYFAEKYPEYKTEFLGNYNSFNTELDSLDNYLVRTMEPYESKKFLIFHPALSYIARDYGLEQISIEIEGKEPTPANIQQIIETAKSENIKVVFVQSQFSTHNAEVIANEINGNVVQIDPLSYDWEENLKIIANEIAKSYSN